MKTTMQARSALLAILTAGLLMAAGTESAGAAPSTGSFAVTPTAPQTAGASVPVSYTITIGNEGLGTSGYVLVHWAVKLPGGCVYPLTNATVTSSKVGATFSLVLNANGREDRSHARVTLTSASPLAAGDTITVRGTVVYARQDTCSGTLQAVVRPAPSAAEYPLSQAYPISVVHGPAARIWVSGEARPVQTTAGRLTVAIVDAYGNQVRSFAGTITASANVPVAGLPMTYTFAATDAGAHDFSVTFPTAGKVARVTVASGALTGISNPILPRIPSDVGIYFGDIHTHTNLSDGNGTIDQAYEYGRRVAGLDFGAVTDHDPQASTTKWTAITDAARRHHRAGRFVTLLGYEFSRDNQDGHRNVYYPDDQGPAEPVVPDITALWDFLKANNLRALTIPHHPNTSTPPYWTATDWSVINAEYQRLVEIYQGRGSFEVPYLDSELKVRYRDEGASVQTALARGHRLGFIASTDSHFGKIGAYGNGVTGVFSPALYRGKIFNRMYMRQCYAVTGDRMLLFFHINGRPMGSELSMTPATSRQITWRAIGQTAIKRVDLLRNNVVYRSWTGNGVADDMQGTVSYTPPLSSREWWYLRVIQTNGELGWASPIWIDPL